MRSTQQKPQWCPTPWRCADRLHPLNLFRISRASQLAVCYKKHGRQNMIFDPLPTHTHILLCIQTAYVVIIVDSTIPKYTFVVNISICCDFLCLRGKYCICVLIVWVAFSFWFLLTFNNTRGLKMW